jgi:hypothetical protein
MHRRFSQLTQVRRELAQEDIKGSDLSTASIEVVNSDSIAIHNEGFARIREAISPLKRCDLPLI